MSNGRINIFDIISDIPPDRRKVIVGVCDEVFDAFKTRLDPAEAILVLVMVLAEVAKLEIMGDGTETIEIASRMAKNVALNRNIMTGIERRHPARGSEQN